ncbi:hypothetical protein [Salinispora mooreana]|uniref:hypothetical protein n=1 Tax=Salinispora mooreana TaxID=999545 RepID=UPI000363A88A|nr:hypothetical protein [Salinispora mooreana]
MHARSSANCRRRAAWIFNSPASTRQTNSASCSTLLYAKAWIGLPHARRSTVTVAPVHTASWPPTPPPAPLIRSVWPAFRPAFSNNACQVGSVMLRWISSQWP